MIHSAGLLIFDFFDDELKVLLVHPGGPYWTNKQEEGWGIPKGKMKEGESVWDTAVRETQEEIGQLPLPVPSEMMFDLGSIKQSSKKTVHCVAVKGRPKNELRSMTVKLEWPKGSGQEVEAPEIEEMRWFTPKDAKSVIIYKQYVFIERLVDKINEQSNT